jgi:hypothetical protein
MTRTSRERSTQYGGDTVPLNYLAKRRVLGKLRSMYGISLPDKVDAPRLRDAVAHALQIPRPDAVEESNRMLAAFAREAPEVGEDLIAKLRARHPFQPLQISARMKYALERAREFHELGSGSDGGNRPAPHFNGCGCELCMAVLHRATPRE